MKVVEFRTATAILGEGVNTHVFPDGRVNQMWAHDPTDGGAAAREFGYGEDWWRFITEHDLAHHFVADRLGRPWSYAIHDAPQVPLHEAPREVQQDEHLANGLLARVNLGRADPYGEVEYLFAFGLHQATLDLAALLDSACGAMPRAATARS